MSLSGSVKHISQYKWLSHVR